MTHYIAYYIVLNLKTKESELDFGDFKIISVRQGKEAADWRKRLSCKIVPHHILIKEFPSYQMQPQDISGIDGIIDSMRDLLLIFRLYKIGDIFFYDSLVEEKDSDNRLIDLYSIGWPSRYRYEFENADISKFTSFRREIIKKPGFKNSFFKFALNRFVSGIDTSFYHHFHTTQRIVDYVTALESIFLIDSEKFFLRKTFSERIGNFLKDNKLKPRLKTMYDLRSKIVHGNYLDKRDIRKLPIEIYEEIIRKTFNNLFDYNFSSKPELVKFVQDLYQIPKEASEIMQEVQEKASKLLP